MTNAHPLATEHIAYAQRERLAFIEVRSYFCGNLTRAHIEERFGIRCFGFLPRLDECVLESRHLGLVTAGENRDLREKMQTPAAPAEQTPYIDALLALAHEAGA